VISNHSSAKIYQIAIESANNSLYCSIILEQLLIVGEPLQRADDSMKDHGQTFQCLEMVACYLLYHQVSVVDH